MEFTIVHFCVIFLAQFVGFFVKGLAGFGDPLITSPIFSMLMENRIISPLNLCFAVPVNIKIAYQSRKEFSPKEILPMAFCVVLGIVPGTFLLKYLAADLLKAILGLVILFLGFEILLRLVNTRENTVYRPLVMAAICFVSGISSGLFGIGMFFVAYLERTKSDRKAFRGSACFIFLVENLFRLAMYIALGLFTKQIILLAFFSLPGMLLGFYAGSKYDTKLSDKTIRYIVAVTFLVGGASVLIRLV